MRGGLESLRGGSSALVSQPVGINRPESQRENCPPCQARCQEYPFVSIFGGMGEDEIQDALEAYKRKVASAGGKARAKKLSAERRAEIATKASKAAAKKRTAEAKKKRKSRARRLS